MKCRESPLLLSEVDAAVSGETSLDPLWAYFDWSSIRRRGGWRIRLRQS